jgi:uncharacterized protein GlcG (DUF336 family)
MSYDIAQKLVADAVAAAQERDMKIAAVVVDTAGHQIAAARMDGVNHIAFDMAFRKARTSGIMGAPTHVLAERMTQDPLISAALGSHPDVILLGGGLPVPGVGGLGVSGGHYTKDQEVAAAAVAGSVPVS